MKENAASFRPIPDKFRSIKEVQVALRHQGLESSQLIVGIDFTASNTWTGRKSFPGPCLHATDRGMNPYEQVLDLIGRTLADFDDDGEIPVLGFGDARTQDTSVFSFFPNGRPAESFEEALERYRQIAPAVRLGGPTSFAPVIRYAMQEVIKTGMQYHILLIIADGALTRPGDCHPELLSDQEAATFNAIVEASNFPLSIILCGVGDGPWDTARKMDDHLPERKFDNFQFVEHNEIMARTARQLQNERDAMFALAALQEIPEQYKYLALNGMVGGQPPQHDPNSFVHPLPPPPGVAALSAGMQAQ